MLIEFQVMMKCNAETKRLVRAANATESAELFVQGYEWQQISFPVGAGSEEVAVVVITPSGRRYEFVVSGEPRPVYKAVAV